MEDAATRFYSRSFAFSNAVRTPMDEARSRALLGKLESPGHRYSSAYKYLSLNAGLDVMEMGYGGIDIVPLIAAKCASYSLIDIVDRTGSADLPGNVRLGVSNLDNDFPFETGRFDVVLAMMIIEHLYDPFHSFSELARVMKPGAKAFVNLPNIASLRCRLQLLAGRMPVTSSTDWFEKREWDGNHLHFFTVHDVRRISALNGLSVVEMHPVGNRLALKSLRPSLFCHEITYVLQKSGH